MPPPNRMLRSARRVVAQRQRARTGAGLDRQTLADDDQEAEAASEAPFAFSVDVEDYFQVQAFASIVPRDTWERWPSRVDENTRRILDLLDGAGSKGTFFTL